MMQWERRVRAALARAGPLVGLDLDGIGMKRFDENRIVPTEQLRPMLARRRAQRSRYQTRIDPTALVFIDGGHSSKTIWRRCVSLPSAGGKRLVAHVPMAVEEPDDLRRLGYGRGIALIASWVLNGPGPINGEASKKDEISEAVHNAIAAT